ELLQDSLKPFLDRSIMAEYPPGSIFKTVVGLAAMEEAVLLPNQGFSCSGAYYYKNVARGCHQHSHPFNIQIALQHSCNTYFFQTLRKLVDKNGFYNPAPGLDTFVQYCYDFGLGQKLGIDLPNESDGNVPTTAYYDYLYPKAKGSWKSPTIMSIGIGQGEIQMTTLQMANLAAIIANRGYYFPPHIAKEFRNSEAQIPQRFLERKTIPINRDFYEPVIDGMERVVTRGTATVAFIPDIAICGKTGTSQNPHGKDHSVFFAFAPKENPQIAIAVYVEHGIWGATYAAPIASLMIEKYLKREIGANRKYLEKRMLDADLISLP
ncbi:MAG: penicillin-binding transpeptidase domain-containing protein, partial [Bacteroidota bacterium]